MSKKEAFENLTRKQLRVVITKVTGERTKRIRKARLVALALKVGAKPVAPKAAPAAKKAA